MTPSSPAPRPQSPPRRGRWLLLLVPLVLVAGGLWLARSSGAPGGGEVPSASSSPVPENSSRNTVATVASSGGAPGVAPGKGPPALLLAPGSPEAEREEQRILWEKRLARAQRSLDTYRESTRYPPESRPAREQPDTMSPSSSERTRPLSNDNADVRLVMKQDKVFVAGDEVVVFSVGCENAQHEPLRCQVTSGTAHEATQTPGAGQVPPVPLDFVDEDGTGTFVTRFQPSKQGFPLYSGTLRVDFKVRQGASEGTAFFDIIYTGIPPATFTGKVREVVEHGSLQLYAGLQVRKPGRYVVTGRVDDESGVPFAYVNFNEELTAGQKEVKLTVFGKLIIDEAPAFPLKLRDVEGFLLKESGDPDRELMPTLRGNVYSTREYPPTVATFSPDEWTSEERQRYLDEFTRDVQNAQSQLDAVTKAPKP